MVIKREKMRTEVRSGLKDGNGDVAIIHFAEGGQMAHCRLLSQMTIPVHGSIGEHVHINETEYYMILEGTGVVHDNGKMREVAAGDLVLTGHHESHSIVNNGDVPLEMIAVIITD